MTALKRHAAACLSLAGLALGACQAEGPRPSVPVGTAQPVAWKLLHAGNTCSSVQPSLVRLGDAQSLAAALADPEASLGAPPRAVPAVDFHDTLVLKLSMGRQPTAGGQFQVQSVAHSSATTLTIHTLWKLPDPGLLQAQVLTHPCLVLSVPRGMEKTVQVLDQNGQHKLSLDLPAR